MNQPMSGYLQKFFGLPLSIFIVLLFVTGCGGGGNGGGSAPPMSLDAGKAQKHGNEIINLTAEM